MEKVKVMKKIPNCVDHGSCPIWFTGSRLTYWRNIWQSEDGRYWVIWYNQQIEVRRGGGYFVTVDKY